MSTSACFDFAASKRSRSSPKPISRNLLGGAAVACLVLGCAWTVYANIFAANVYPTLDGANFDAPVVRRSPVVAVRSTPPAPNRSVAASEPPPLISAPATVPSAPSLSFDDRFAAASPQAIQPPPHPTTPNPPPPP